jgi:general stress protein 26
MDIEHVDDFSVVAEEIDRRITSTIWCTLATTDTAGRPRTRVVHPVWEIDDGGAVGWLGTRTGTPKLTHLERTPWASLLYWDPRHQQVTVDASVTVHTDEATCERVWALMSSFPEPYGFDPAPMWPDGATGDGFTVLRFDPVRVTIFGNPPQMWRAY